jgi:hypothetical protein
MRRPDLSKYFNPAALPGFSVPADVTAPKVTEPRFISVADGASETEQVLANLSKEILDRKPDPEEKIKGLSGETVRGLVGREGFTGDTLIANGLYIDRSTPGKSRAFYIVDVRHKNRPEIIVEESGRKAIRSYLLKADGSLESAVVTIKVNGKAQVDKIPDDEARVGLEELLKFWKEYYLKTVKLAQKT